MSQQPPLDKREFEQLSQFRYRLRCFLRQSEDICRRHGLTPLQYQLLLHLRGFPEREWASIGELAERLQAKHHGVVALVDRCEQLGLVERRRGREDRRQIEVHLLEEGVTRVTQIAQAHQPELRHLQEDTPFPFWGNPD
ncbi:winged helix-turn-helix transcriptional regulator [Halomonas aquamarina]|uniref:Winged helix-turn-helix transcriptional regulator n=1 Tax=Vreelandella aquamarina TaxID=77097 RepID=A0ACC5VQT9_9GAMM|nr:helix-turn-helix domain-containing protein [Halomonas aquamarina]MBZ5486503.1 winged helix-turn-helix transcriptional regulator [Halomonas aquamarina]